MNLSLRLNKICEAVNECESLCDVGCDHGYVSIELVKSGKVSRVLAMDVNEGPLASAKANIGAAGLSEKIETRLSDGLHNIKDGECFDAILIAGMGGRLTEKILTEGRKTVLCAKQLILQPQSEIFLVRRFIKKHGFEIKREYCIKDAGKYYFLIDAGKTEGALKELPGDSEFFEKYSEFLLRSKDAVYREFLEHRAQNIDSYLMRAGDNSPELCTEKEELKKALEFFG